jgi:ABC-type nickel/cobalt efflux system permease component RcnA
LIAAVTGLVAGITHVLSGPDHLAAIAPLAVRRPKAAWVPGMRWGIGHSAGVAVIGLLSLWLRDLLPIKLISSWGERFVGIMLIAIGYWALRKAFKVHAHEHEHDGDRHVHLHSHSHSVPHHEPAAHQRHTHAAFGIGILHGLAGSSHFLGVLPILAFPTRLQALTYLFTFGAGTVMAMASFSGFMGWVTRACATDSAKIYRRLMTICAASAMAVGCFWLFGDLVNLALARAKY